jgi:excisionase family DNA binding protein
MSPARLTYTVPEAAHLLGMKESVLRERIRVSRVPLPRLGRRVLIRNTTVERLLASGEARPRP